jgi:hypothetical protein
VIGRWRALVAKELRQHAMAAIALAAVLAIALAVLTAHALTAQRVASVIEADMRFLWTFMPLAAVVLGNRLVVSEYEARTQTFVEALPVRRVEMVTAKYGLGLAALAGAAGAALAWTLAIARASEPVDARFVAVLAARSAAFVWLVWSFLFAMGFLGRFRITGFLLLGIAAGVAIESREIDLTRFGPVALLDPLTFPFERHDVPAGPLAVTCALALAWTAFAFALALLREGSIAESLAGRMTQKEKAGTGILVVSILMVLFFLDERRTPAPFAFTGSGVVKSARLPIQVQHGEPAIEPEARALLSTLETDMAQLARELSLPRLPPVRVAYSPELDGRTFEVATLSRTDGVLVRAGFRQRPGWDRASFRALVLREVLRVASSGRATFEPHRWLHDGLARWWAEREAPDRCSVRSAAWARALWLARERSLSEADLAAWSRFRERWGEPVSEGLAGAGLAVLEKLRGRAAVIALARAHFGRDVARDMREVVRELAHPPADVFAQATGLEWSRFVDAWRQELASSRAGPEGVRLLARVPRLSASVWVDPGRGDQRTVRYRVGLLASTDGMPARERSERPSGTDLQRPRPEAAPTAGIVCALVHAPLSPLPQEIPRDELRREEQVWRAGAAEVRGALEGRYSRGGRAFLAVEVTAEPLDVPLRLVAERRECM